MLEKIKIILGIDENNTESDIILNLMIEDTTTAILNYCNIKQLPEQLEYVVRQIVVDSFNNEAGNNVASIKRGDTQITYATPIDINQFNQKQLSSLNRFRKIVAR